MKNRWDLPAFPAPSESVQPQSRGLTKREYIVIEAMKNLQNVLARSSGQRLLLQGMGRFGVEIGEAVIAKLAVIQAKELMLEMDIEARNQEAENGETNP